MLQDQLKTDLQAALKAKDALKVSILRFVLASLTNARIAKGQELSDVEIEAEIAKEVKRHRESIAAFTAGGRADLAEQEQAELAILQSYLPEQLSDDALAAIVAATIDQMHATSKQDMGKVIGAVMAKVRGKAEGGRVSAIVAQKLL